MEMIKIEFINGKKPLEIEADTLKEAVDKIRSKRNDFYGLDLRNADFRNVDIKDVDLFEIDLRGANLDESCWPLSDGSFKVIIDKRIFCQLLYHTLCAGQSVDDPEVKHLFEIPEVLNLANKYHKAKEYGFF